MEDIRWIQRLDNLESANALIGEVVENVSVDSLSDLEKQGLIQRFEFTFELAWKTLQDYLVYLGYEFQSGPNSTLKTALENSLIAGAEEWRQMSKARNLSTHTYDETAANKIVNDIYGIYYYKLKELVDCLVKKKSTKEIL
jgi:nucleotidyltransferase substrate binding protein (TIGR01987 family)